MPALGSASPCTSHKKARLIDWLALSEEMVVSSGIHAPLLVLRQSYFQGLVWQAPNQAHCGGASWIEATFDFMLFHKGWPLARSPGQ